MRLGKLGRRGGGGRRDRVVVLGLDGVPFTHARGLIEAGELPNLAAVVAEGALAQMDTTIPNVSSVAWATFMTGQNPGKHNIFGFIDRESGTRKLYIPNSRTMDAATLWEILSAAGRRVFAMNVPTTYPPRPVNGIVVGCFLSPSVEKAAPTPEIARALKRLNYCVDADAQIAHRDKASFLVHLDEVFERRLDAMRYFWRSERWDFFMAHIMETDRLHHFFWTDMEEDGRFASDFADFYRRLDEVVGEVRGWLDEETRLVVLSDHGFCSIKQQVNVNTWLHEAGFLRYLPGNGDAKKGLETLAPDTRAFSLDPGRIFITAGEGEYERVRDELAEALAVMKDPQSGEEMVERVYRREELYEGPHAADAADLVLAMREGYDPKGAFRKESLTFRDDALVGMHTTPDALLYVQGVAQFERRPHIVDVAPTILDLLGIDLPPGLDGRSLLAG